MFTKQLCSLCSNVVAKRICAKTSNVSRRVFSSKNSGKRNKKPQKIVVSAKNDFVTHQLNTSIAAHLRRQQQIRDYLQEEERKSHRQNRKNIIDIGNIDKFQDIVPKHTQRDSSYGKRASRQNDVYGQNTYQAKNYNRKFPRNESYAQGKGHGKKLNKQNAVVSSNESNNLDEEDFSGSESDDFELEELETPDWNDMKLVSINRTFYNPSQVTNNRTWHDIEEFRQNTHMKCKDGVSKPIFKFNELIDLGDKLIGAIEKQQFIECTPVQAQAIPLALSAANIVCVSQPGTGKTLAMILSAIVHISNQTPAIAGDGPIAIILALKSETAEHIQQTANEFCDQANIKCSLLNDNPNQAEFNKSTEAVELLIATPDSLYENLRTKSLSLHRCSHFALYEADKMVNIGLDEEITQIAHQIRPDCQRVMWSTAWNFDLKLLITELCDDYTRLDVSTAEIESNISPDIKQIVKVGGDKKKEIILNEIIDSIDAKAQISHKTLIFAESQENADKIVDILKKRGCNSNSFHNRKSTIQRDAILTAFHNDEFQFLVLTDVAAKNINLCRIWNVINFDMPICISDYVDRVKRTGRINDGNSTSYAIVTEEDGHLADDLIAVLRQSKQTVDPALFILKAANADSDDEVSFAIPKGKSFQKYTIDRTNSCRMSLNFGFFLCSYCFMFWL